MVRKEVLQMAEHRIVPTQALQLVCPTCRRQSLGLVADFSSCYSKDYSSCTFSNLFLATEANLSSIKVVLEPGTSAPQVD